MPKASRPGNVVLLAVLEYALGISGVLVGALAVGVATESAVGSASGESSLFLALSILVAALAVLFLAAGWGTWAGRPWAWTMGMTLAVLGLLSNLTALAQSGSLMGSVVGGLLDFAIIYGLTRPDVKTYLGRAQLRSTN